MGGEGWLDLSLVEGDERSCCGSKTVRGGSGGLLTGTVAGAGGSKGAALSLLPSGRNWGLLSLTGGGAVLSGRKPGPLLSEGSAGLGP